MVSDSVDTDDGELITGQEVLATGALDRIGEVLSEQGLSLEELIESGREERGNLIQEQYGIRLDDDRLESSSTPASSFRRPSHDEAPRKT